jgi:hypothetical protein
LVKRRESYASPKQSKGKERKEEGGVWWLEKFLSKHLFSQWTNIFLPLVHIQHLTSGIEQESIHLLI